KKPTNSSAGSMAGSQKASTPQISAPRRRCSTSCLQRRNEIMSPPRRQLPPRPRQALSAHRQTRAGPGAPHDRNDDVPRDGDDVLAGEGTGRGGGARLMRSGTSHLRLTEVEYRGGYQASGRTSHKAPEGDVQ